MAVAGDPVRGDHHRRTVRRDPDGLYAYVPLDAGRLALDGERTRGP
jgi:hypothetical protein